MIFLYLYYCMIRLKRVLVWFPSILLYDVTTVITNMVDPYPYDMNTVSTLMVDLYLYYCMM